MRGGAVKVVHLAVYEVVPSPLDHDGTIRVVVGDRAFFVLQHPVAHAMRLTCKRNHLRIDKNFNLQLVKL